MIASASSASFRTRRCLKGPKQQDFPAAAADSQGAGAWIAAVWHEPRGPELLPAVNEQPKNFADSCPPAGGDQVRLLHFQNGKAGEPLDVTEPGRDVWRPAVATAGDGSVVVVWTEKRDDNWDLFSRRYDPKTSSFSPELRITDQPGPDSDAVLATAAERHGLDGLASVDRRPGRYPAGPARRRAASRPRRPSRSATRRPTSGRPRIAAD